jgi:hypothetical protein
MDEDRDEPAEASQRPGGSSDGRNALLRGLSARKEGGVAGEVTAWGQRRHDLVNHIWFIGNEMDGVAQTDQVDFRYAVRQLIGVSLYELHGLSLEALARKLQRLAGRLDAKHGRRPPQPLQLVQNELRHRSGA